MPQSPRLHRSLRLLDYDYTYAGAYVVAICTERLQWHLDHEYPHRVGA